MGSDSSVPFVMSDGGGRAGGRLARRRPVDPQGRRAHGGGVQAQVGRWSRSQRASRVPPGGAWRGLGVALLSPTTVSWPLS